VDASDRFFLAMAYRKLGKHDESREAYNKPCSGWRRKRKRLARCKRKNSVAPKRGGRSLGVEDEVTAIGLDNKAAGEVLTAKQAPHRPGTAPGARSARRMRCRSHYRADQTQKGDSDMCGSHL